MRILVVDDDKGITGFLKKALEEECFEVDIANDGQKGGFLAKTSDYDLVILDYNLPNKNGREICEDLRKENISTKILMLSVEAESHQKADLLNIGADDYMAKPFSFEELLARIRALLRRPKDIKTDVFKLDDLVLDVKKHTITRSGKRIYLTVKEFMLLEYLAQNSGNVVSRGMILEHVWDMNADPFSNTIEAHVSNLRKRIDTPDKKKLIYTVPGRGYKIDIEQ